MFSESEYIPLSALQHFTYCPRQCALIHLDREWAENVLTTFGKIEHERVDSGVSGMSHGVRTVRSVHLVSSKLGIRGIADAVEYHPPEKGGAIIPVEYKHGRPKEHLADEIQLCAQALCLEEMHSCHIPTSCLYYHSIRHRVSVEITSELRSRTEQVIKDTRKLLLGTKLPPAQHHNGCDACSLRHICLPSVRSEQASEFNNSQFENMLCEE